MQSLQRLPEMGGARFRGCCKNGAFLQEIFTRRKAQKILKIADHMALIGILGIDKIAPFGIGSR
ncbi:MAG: hypothetical protein RIS52_1836, partial [Pseudomonadota bacterium]